MNERQINLFWEKVEKAEEDNGCWEWTGSRINGYGHLCISKENVYSHRVSYMLHSGKDPDGMLVLHHCDNPSCVNPDHLFLGTYRDNTQDMIRKGRSGLLTQPPCQGERAE